MNQETRNVLGMVLEKLPSNPELRTRAELEYAVWAARLVIRGMIEADEDEPDWSQTAEPKEANE